MILMRHEVGDVLRDFRLHRGMTLRQVAKQGNLALGYLSEVERGQKEISSELLQSVANALDVPLSAVLIEVGQRLALFEEAEKPPVKVPDVVPDYFYDRQGG